MYIHVYSLIFMYIHVYSFIFIYIHLLLTTTGWIITIHEPENSCSPFGGCLPESSATAPAVRTSLGCNHAKGAKKPRH